MQTIEEYKAYTKQLEGEVGKWHHAYDALMVERNQLVKRIKELENQLKKGRIKMQIQFKDVKEILNKVKIGGG